MSNLATQNGNHAITLEQVLVNGNLSSLTPDQRVSYYNQTCESLGLNPMTKPFEYITLNGKLTLYAKRDCTDQLRKLHNVSISIKSRENVSDVFAVTAQATTPTGRTDESIGAVAIGNLKGEQLANALMKAETKAKRRVTLSICGMGMLDETEIETIPGAAPANPPPAQRDTPKSEKPAEPKVRMWQLAGKWTGLPPEDRTSAINEMCADLDFPPAKDMSHDQCEKLAGWIEEQMKAKLAWTDWVNK